MQKTFDSNLGEVAVNTSLYSITELVQWLRNNRPQIEGQIKRELGAKSGLATYAKKQGLEVLSEKDPAPMPEPFIVTRTANDSTGDQSLHLKRGTIGKVTSYSEAVGQFTPDAQKWLNAQTASLRGNLQGKIDRQKAKVQFDAEIEARGALRQARNLIEADSKLAPAVREARVAINPAYSERVKHAAAVVGIELEAKRSKQDFAAAYAKAKLARRV
jgi:hypothetical protein